MTERIPADLLRLVQADHRPVRPLPPPWLRALALAPLGALLVLGVPLFWGWRENLPELGHAAAWGLSGLQALAGLLVLGVSLREAVPGRTLSRRALLLTGALALALEVGITLVTAAVAPLPVPPGNWIRYFYECTGAAALSGIPLLVAGGWLALRALPTRPALTGAIVGLGAGLIVDAGVRLFCRVSDPGHVLVSHGAAVLILMGVGAAAASLLDRRGGR